MAYSGESAGGLDPRIADLQSDTTPLPEREEAMASIVGDYHAALLRLARRVLGFSQQPYGSDSAIDAENVVQDAWLSAYQGISTFKYDNLPLNWLFKITNNRAIDTLRKNS